MTAHTLTTCPLSALSTGQSAKIADIASDEHLLYRLAALGFRAGKSLSILRRARFNGPLHIRLGTTDVILRNTEAAKILVQPNAA